MFKNRKIKVRFYGVNLKMKLYYYSTLIISFLFIVLLSTFVEIDYLKRVKEFIVVIFLISIFHEYITSELSFIESLRIKAKLKKVISNNKLFIEKGFLSSSLLMKFYTDDNHLYVEAYPTGVDYLSRLERLGKVIETTLNLSLIDSQNQKADRFTYTYEKSKPKRINVQYVLFKNSNKGVIPLDSEKSWN